MTILELLITAAAVWYLAYAITSTHGPFGIFERARKFTALGGLLECPVCASPWLAGILFYIQTGRIDLIQVFAIAGAAMLLHGATNWRFAQ